MKETLWNIDWKLLNMYELHFKYFASFIWNYFHIVK